MFAFSNARDLLRRQRLPLLPLHRRRPHQLRHVLLQQLLPHRVLQRSTQRPVHVPDRPDPDAAALQAVEVQPHLPRRQPAQPPRPQVRHQVPVDLERVRRQRVRPHPRCRRSAPATPSDTPPPSDAPASSAPRRPPWSAAPPASTRPPCACAPYTNRRTRRPSASVTYSRPSQRPSFRSVDRALAVGLARRLTPAHRARAAPRTPSAPAPRPDERHRPSPTAAHAAGSGHRPGTSRRCSSRPTSSVVNRIGGISSADSNQMFGVTTVRSSAGSSRGCAKDRTSTAPCHAPHCSWWGSVLPAV